MNFACYENINSFYNKITYIYIIVEYISSFFIARLTPLSRPSNYIFFKFISHFFSMVSYFYVFMKIIISICFKIILIKLTKIFQILKY